MCQSVFGAIIRIMWWQQRKTRHVYWFTEACIPSYVHRPMYGILRWKTLKCRRRRDCLLTCWVRLRWLVANSANFFILSMTMSVASEAARGGNKRVAVTADWTDCGTKRIVPKVDRRCEWNVDNKMMPGRRHAANSISNEIISNCREVNMRCISLSTKCSLMFKEWIIIKEVKKALIIVR